MAGLQMVGDVFSALTAAVGAADKVVELIQRKPGVPPQGALQPADFVGRVELDRVAFSYPARPDVPVLNGLTLSINPGEVSFTSRLCHSCQIQRNSWVTLFMERSSDSGEVSRQLLCG